MWVPEEVEFGIMFTGALLFSVLTLFDESDVEDPDIPTYWALLIRRPIFSFFAFYMWVTWGAMSLSINNCETQFGCFTTLYQAATTSVVTPGVFDSVLGQMGFIFAAIFLVLGVFFSLLNSYTVIRRSYLGRRSRPLGSVDQT